MDYNAKARSILLNVLYATLATVNADGSPWNSPVYCAYDEGGNLYWSSTPDAVHSQNILRSGQVFIVVYDSTSEVGEGVYLQCKAEMLQTKTEIQTGLDLLGKRRGAAFKNIEKFMEPGPQRIFRAIPEQCWVNDADKDEDGDFVRDFRVPIK